MVRCLCHYQRRWLKAIHKIRKQKQEQKRLMDSGVTLVEMHKQQHTMYNMMTESQDTYDGVKTKAAVMEINWMILQVNLII